MYIYTGISAIVFCTSKFYTNVTLKRSVFKYIYTAHVYDMYVTQHLHQTFNYFYTNIIWLKAAHRHSADRWSTDKHHADRWFVSKHCAEHMFL